MSTLPVTRLFALAAALFCGVVASAQTPLSVTVTATDAANLSTSKTFATTLNASAVAPVTITTTALLPFTPGVPYTQTLTFSGGTAPITCTATGLPAGVTISSTCVISGTPTGLVGTNPTGGGGTSPPVAGPVAVPLSTGPEVFPSLALGVNTDQSSLTPIYGPTFEYNKPIDTAPLDPLSASLIATVSGTRPATDGAWYVNTVDSSVTPLQFVASSDTGDTDAVLAPVSSSEWIENGTGAGVFPGGDAHAIILDRATGLFYESYATTAAQSDYALQVFDSQTAFPIRPYERSSVSADGLAILPGILRYQDAVHGLNHALRMTFANVDPRSFRLPAVHSGGSGNPGVSGAFVYGMRLRLAASWQPKVPLSTLNSNIIAGLKKYGVWVSDAGQTGYISSSNEPDWAVNNYTDIQVIFGKNNTAGLDLSNFEVVNTGQPQYAYQGFTAPAGYIAEPTGTAPVITSFTCAKDTTGAYTVFTLTNTGLTNVAYVNGATVIRNGTLTIPYAAKTYTATVIGSLASINNGAVATATCTVQ